MQSNWQSIVLIDRRLILGLLLAAQAWASEAAVTKGADVKRLQSALREHDSVSFYFISRTGRYSFTKPQIKSEATIFIRRRCGANCHRFMQSVAQHLAESVPFVCQSGQEDLLIEVGQSAIEVVYSHSGRSIEVEGVCYFNEMGIGSIVRDPGFLFR